MTYGDNVLDFSYDINGVPVAMRHGYASHNNYVVYYYITNLQGNVVRLVDIYGNTAAYYEYDAFGNVLEASGSHANVNPLRYRGYVYDHDTGLYYLQSRYYDPKVGRHLNRDVVFDLDTGVQGYNLFAYCGNAPVFRIDVCGTDSDDIDPFDDDTRPEFHQDEGGSPYSGGNPNSIPFYCGSGTVSSGSGAPTASGGGTYHYSVDCTVGGNSSIYSGGTWGSGYTAYSYYTQSSTSSSKHTAYNPLANITYTKKLYNRCNLVMITAFHLS